MFKGLALTRARRKAVTAMTFILIRVLGVVTGVCDEYQTEGE
jgi:hypothetical protein